MAPDASQPGGTINPLPDLEGHLARIAEQGYTILPDAIEPELLDRRLTIGVIGEEVAPDAKRLIRHVGATRTSLVTYLIPPIALAYCAVFLATAESNYLTGQVLQPNGGWVMA